MKNKYYIPKSKWKKHYKPAVFCSYNCTYIVTDPTGSIKKELHEPISKHTLIFNINNHLRLDLTFPFIYIIFKHLHDCPIGKLHIVSAGQNYIFCGIYSNMVNYPPGNSVNIYVNTFIENATVLYKLSHTVFDKHQIKSMTIPHNVRQYIMWIIKFEIRNISIWKFHLLTKKLNYLNISITGKLINSVFVYDGPDDKSYRIKSTAGFYLTSTFQCILHIYLANIMDYSILANDIEYSSSVKSVTRLVYLPRNVPQNILLNPSQGNYVLLHVFTDEIYFINIATVKLLYNGFNDPICTYAGITVFNHFDKSDDHISTECFSYDGFYNYQNMYSRSNEVFLVFYYYKEYGDFMATLIASPTTCKVVFINPCGLNLYCKFPNNSLCNELRKEVALLDFAHIQTKLEKLNNPTVFKYIVGAGKCYVLQIEPRIMATNLKALSWGCRIYHLMHRNIFQPELKIHHHVTVFLPGEF